MKGKRGIFFMFYLVFWTLLMCGTVMVLYHVQQKQLSVSLVSPLTVLNVRDNLTMFEMREVNLIKSSLEKTNGTFGTDSFNRNFRDNFLKAFEKNKKMTNFILENLTWKGSIVEPKSKSDSGEFYEKFYKNILYPSSGMRMNSGKLIFYRTKVGKTFYLVSGNAKDINFPVTFKFEFDRKYIISKTDGKFNVEAG